MATLAVLQARMSSQRLPGKVLLPVLGEPMIFRQIERIERCESFDALVVATSMDSTDDELAIACKQREIDCFRGELDDVLLRFTQVVSNHEADTIVRLTADCPLADPELIDAVVRYYENGDYDYVCNCDPPTFPDGLDVEVIRRSCLLQAEDKASLASEREHVTTYIRNRPDTYRIGNYSSDHDRSGWRWTVDEAADLEFVRRIYAALYPENMFFTTNNIIKLIEEEPSLLEINTHLKRNEGYEKSLRNDFSIEPNQIG